jgi:putative endonuclease
MSKIKGDEAEKKALTFLINNNFTLIEQNFYAKKLGEIDIIVKKNDTYHFCEVKSAKDYEIAINNLNKTKIAKLKRSVEYYLQFKKLDVIFCIDALIVVENEITYLENITF